MVGKAIFTDLVDGTGILGAEVRKKSQWQGRQDLLVRSMVSAYWLLRCEQYLTSALVAGM
jgi:hypothetical protein